MIQGRNTSTSMSWTQVQDTLMIVIFMPRHQHAHATTPTFLLDSSFFTSSQCHGTGSSDFGLFSNSVFHVMTLTFLEIHLYLCITCQAAAPKGSCRNIEMSIFQSINECFVFLQIITN